MSALSVVQHRVAVSVNNLYLNLQLHTVFHRLGMSVLDISDCTGLHEEHSVGVYRHRMANKACPYSTDGKR